MFYLQLLLFAFGVAAGVRARVAVHGTALTHAVHWGLAAWCGWGLAIYFDGMTTLMPATTPSLPIQVALCLTGCAGIAVLGARRPQAAAWNFVVVALLAVMLLPLVEEAIIGTRSLDWMRGTFLMVTLCIGLLSYLPTRFGLAAFLAGVACAGELTVWAAPQGETLGKYIDMTRFCLLAAPMVAWLFATRVQADGLDGLWRDFRDRWGLVWGLRVREQFNRAAANAGWPVTLHWSGFAFQRPVESTTIEAIREVMRGLLQRFVETKNEQAHEQSSVGA